MRKIMAPMELFSTPRPGRFPAAGRFHLQSPGGGRMMAARVLRPLSGQPTVFVSAPTDKELLMNLTISGHHLEVTPPLRDYVVSKLDRIARHFDQVVDIRVLLTVDNMTEKQLRQRAECSVHVKGRDLFAESSHADLYAAIDELADKLDRQVARHKTRIQNHHHMAVKRQVDGSALSV